ncbi:MAG: hypothetical protein FJY67_06610 [Calditrichaeota bacterium]|nr:hypothetical protein [Calditrichota bacterium]
MGSGFRNSRFKEEVIRSSAGCPANRPDTSLMYNLARETGLRTIADYFCAASLELLDMRQTQAYIS